MMNGIIDFFSVQNIAFTCLGYPVSWIELLATVFTIINIYLAIQQRILNFPFALIAIALSYGLFFQSALYADSFLQIFFFTVTIYGWWHWSNGSFTENELPVTLLTITWRIVAIALIIVLTPITAWCMIHLNSWWPKLFTQPTAFPYSDSFILVSSMVGQWLLARKKLENWWCWIAVNIMAIVVYYLKVLMLFSILYFILLIM